MYVRVDIILFAQNVVSEATRSSLRYQKILGECDHPPLPGPPNLTMLLHAVISQSDKKIPDTLGQLCA